MRKWIGVRPWLADVIAAGVALGLIAATFVLPGGEDLHLVYRPLAEGCLDCAYVPYHASWLLLPLRLIPLVWLWPIWTAVSIAGVWWAAKRLGTPPAVALASFPMLAYVWLGQPDVLIVVGLTLALVSKNPYVRGVGLLLASIKPQVAGPALLFLLVRDEQPLRTAIIPAAVLAASLAVWGIDWPVRWLNFIATHPKEHAWASGVIFPYGLLAFPLAALFREKRDQLTVILLATTLGVPRVGIYSHIAYLVLFAPWWAVPLSYGWAAAFPWMAGQALRFSFVLPLGVLSAFVLPTVRARWAEYRAGGDVVAAAEDGGRR